MKPTFYLKFLKKVILVNFYRNLGIPFQIPYKLTFDITYNCDSRCKMCRIWSFYTEHPEKKNEEIRLDEFRTILQNLKDDVFWITFGGGEPTLRKDLPEFIEIASTLCKNIGLITVSTNGLNPRLIEKQFRESNRRCKNDVELLVMVSIDGLKTTHNRVRGVDSGFQKAVTTLEKLRRIEEKNNNFHVGIQITISKFNLEGLEDFLDNFLSKVPIFFTFAVQADVYKNKGLDVSPPSNSRLFKILNFIDEKYRIKDTRSFMSKVYLKLAKSFFSSDSQKMLLPCYASFATLTINAFTDVRACDPYSSIIGNLRENNYDILKILKSEKCKEIRENIKFGKCHGCWISCEAYPTIFQNFPRSLFK